MIPTWYTGGVKVAPISIADALGRVAFLADRTPHTTPEEAADAFAELGPYRNGAIYVGHYAGNSEWERHPHGDEIVAVIDGETTLILLDAGVELRNHLGAGELLVVPQNVWHRFETPAGVKILTVTPQPTDRRVERPND